MGLWHVLSQRKGTAAKTTLEGKNGFYNAFAGSHSKINEIVDGLGKKYEILKVFKSFRRIV
jgi:hypothetical protein